MGLPVTFATLPSGDQQLILLDTQFAAIGAIGVIPCSAAGQNSIALTPNANTPTISAYTDLAPSFSFSAAQTSNSAVTINVNSLGARNAYKQNGQTQCGSGDLVSGMVYKATFLTALNSGAGGFVVDVVPLTISPSILRGYIGGMTLSNDGVTPNTILDISAGVATDSTNTVQISLAAITKTTGGAWVSGSGNAGMGSGLTIANNTWYHVFAIINGGNADAYFDTDPGAANKPAGTTAFRRVGSFKTDGSAHIRAFIQSGDFFWKLETIDYNSTAAQAMTLTAFDVPSGIVVQPILSVVFLTTAANANTAVTVAPAGNSALFSTIHQLGNGGATSALLGNQVIGPNTNTSSQINLAVTITSGALTSGQIRSGGWVDTRGRFS